MKVTILFKDNSELTIENVKKVSNASTTIKEDYLYIYNMNDEPGNPRFRVKISDIICAEVV